MTRFHDHSRLGVLETQKSKAKIPSRYSVILSEINFQVKVKRYVKNALKIRTVVRGYVIQNDNRHIFIENQLLKDDGWVKLEDGDVMTINGLDGYALPKLHKRHSPDKLCWRSHITVQGIPIRRRSPLLE